MGGCILRGYNGIAFSLCGLSNVPNPAMANKPPVPDMVVSVRQSYINDAVKLMSRSIQLCLSSPVVIQLHLELVVFLLENPDLRPDSASLIGVTANWKKKKSNIWVLIELTSSFSSTRSGGSPRQSTPRQPGQ